MKILHTSDWHLGRTFHGRVLDDDQAVFADHLVDLVRRERVDAVLISGDVYDRAVPPTSAVLLLNETLRRLSELTHVVLTPGNHDSATRLGFASALLRPELAVRASATGISTPIALPDRDGGTGAYVYALPYLDPDAARAQLPPLLRAELGETGNAPCQQDAAQGTDADEAAAPNPGSSDHHPDGGPVRDDPACLLPRSHEAVVAAALRLVGADLARRRTGERTRVPALVMAHAFVSGGYASPHSERDLRVGGVESVPSSLFATLGGSPHAQASGGIDYVALGHLHRPQEISVPAGQADGTHLPHLVYSGSPLALSFSEAPWAKSTVLTEVTPSGVVSLERVPAPVPHPVVTVTGTMPELLSPRTQVPPHAWVRVIVKGLVGPGDHARLREHLGEVLAVSQEAPPREERPQHVHEDVAVADPCEVASRFLQDVTGSQADPAHRAVLAQAYEAVLAANRSA